MNISGWIKNKFGGGAPPEPSDSFDFENSILFTTIFDKDCSRKLDIYLDKNPCLVQQRCSQPLGFVDLEHENFVIGDSLVGVS